uniref:Uncharacterized protein n=1 Tax=Myoviridae sp. ct9Ns12 TaxID=2826626 RepID=A0A8S5MHL7_9CAUD|nr:MAG TPA: hypothetical protein [Myoviridae sp. ct9Ns12]
MRDVNALSTAFYKVCLTMGRLQPFFYFFLEYD